MHNYDPGDYSVISFPFFGIEVDPARAISLGSLNIHYYALFIATGLLLAIAYACRRNKEFGFTEDHILDGVLCVVPFAVLCARLYYCIFSWESYRSDLISILYIWKGGLAIYGGVIGAAVGVAVYCKVRKLNLPALLDLVALGFLIGQCLGRWGNFMNREAFGAPVSSDYFLAMGLFNTKLGVTEYFHPTFLYESVWNLMGFVLLHFASKRRKYDGQVALGYVAWYGLGRTFIEGLRTDSLMLGPFRFSQVLAAVSCFAAVAVLMLLHFRPHKPEDLFVNRQAAKEEKE